jgi:hypothetical protein
MRNYALGAIHADAAFTAGASGSGITVAVIDSGVDGSIPELQGQVSSLSIDANNSRNTPVGTDGHATWVAGVIADKFNGAGSVGVAYNSTILSVRADVNSTTCNGEVCISANMSATGIDYAISQHAKIVNMSFGSADEALGPAFEAALQRGVNAGLIFVASAGNESAATPDWPGLYAADPRFAGSIIVAGATTRAGALASYSNLAGTTASAYMTAPGDKVIVNCGSSTCDQVSGTSFAAPAIAGAAALLLQAFPTMTGRQVIDLLLKTADDEGAAGTDSTYGRGALNLQRAFSPVGSLQVVSATTVPLTLTSTPGSYVTPAVGDAIARGQGLITVGRDSYDRLFRVNLAQAYRPGGASILAADPAVLSQTSDLDLPSFAQGHMHVSANLQSGRLDPADRFHWMLSSQDGGNLTVSYERSGFAVSAWKGGALTNPFSAPVVDAFTSVAQPDRAVQAAFSRGPVRFTAEAGAGNRLSPDHMRRESGSHYARAALATTLGGVTTSFGAGELVEPLGPLGSYMPQASGFGLPSKTGFVSASANWRIADGLAFNGEAALGRTKLEGAFLSTAAPALSSTWRMSLDMDCKTWGLRCTSAHLTLSQPLRIEGGTFSAVLPDVPLSADDPLTFSTRRFNAAPSGRELDLRMQADKDLGAFGTVSLQGVAAREPANIQTARAAFGLLAGWRTTF